MLVDEETLKHINIMRELNDIERGVNYVGKPAKRTGINKNLGQFRDMLIR